MSVRYFKVHLRSQLFILVIEVAKEDLCVKELDPRGLQIVSEFYFAVSLVFLGTTLILLLICPTGQKCHPNNEYIKEVWICISLGQIPPTGPG